MSSSFPLSHYVHSLIEILHTVSAELVQADASTRISELFCDEFDDLDLELVLFCFEATHRVAFKEKVWQVTLETFEELTLEEFLEEYLDPSEQHDPLFVTKRFLMYDRSLTDALLEQWGGSDRTDD
jgi:hypothetical protein